MDDEAAIRSVIAGYLAAYEAHDGAGCGAVYSDDAIVLSPWGPPRRGPDAIAAAHVEWFREGETNKVMSVVDVVADGDLGICLLRYEADIPGDGAAAARAFGASLNVLRRQSDGAWKISHCSLNELEDNRTGFEE